MYVSRCRQWDRESRTRRQRICDSFHYLVVVLVIFQLVTFAPSWTLWHCQALSMKPLSFEPSPAPWLNEACIAWDPAAIDENSCYWNEEWLSLLRQNPTDRSAQASDDDEDKQEGDKRSSGICSRKNHFISYQTLLATASLIVVELRERMMAHYHCQDRSITQNNEKYLKNSEASMPVVLAIPEGPLLPLATLVVHALNHPSALPARNGNDAASDCIAILVPLEPSEAKKRNLHILKDIAPTIILSVPGKDSENIRAVVDSLPTIDPSFVDFCTLLRCAFKKVGQTQDVLFRILEQNQSMLDAKKYPIGMLIATLAAAVAVAEETIEQESLSVILATIRKRQLAEKEPRISHIVYTSGTTGIPKGCVSSNSSLEQYLKSKNHAHGIDESSTILLASALSFDPCLSDCLAAFQARATLAIAPRSALLAAFPNTLQQLQVTHVLCTPTLWSLMGDYRPSHFEHLQVVALGGEPIPIQLQSTWGRRKEEDRDLKVKSSCRLFATYGVTEACVYQTCGEVFAASKQAKGKFVGQPLEGIRIRICREDIQDKLIDVNQGGLGEIVLYGSQLDAISGYWNRPDLNRKFIMDEPNRANPPIQYYRTGDRGTFESVANNLYVTGRIVGEEGMVKVNGVRVELGEIEKALIDEIEDSTNQDAPVVLHCMAKVMPIPSGADDSSGRNEIGAYCLLSKKARNELNISDGDVSSGILMNGGPILTLLQSRCMDNLKAACIPKSFVIISRLPLSPTGKRNRDGLPNLDSCPPLQSAGEELVLLKDFGRSGKKVAEVLISSLNLQPSQESMLTTTATFAMLGGDSLAATRVTRALYAYHHQVENNRFLGGEFGKLPGEFDVLTLLKSKDLGAFVAMLDSKNLCQPEGHGGKNPILEENTDLDGKSGVNQPEDADAVKQKALHNALVQAITLGQSSIAIGLLSVGANPNHSLHSGRLSKVTHKLKQRALFRSSPLHIACLQGDSSVVKKLLEKGSKTNSPDASGVFPIHLASSGVNVGNERDPFKDDMKRVLCVQYLLDVGVPVTMRDGNKQSILHCAARSGHCELLKFVMTMWKNKYGDEIISPKHFFNWNDRWFRTPVHWAVLNGNPNALEILLRMGCNASPFKPKTNNRSSAAIESPMEICKRLYDIKDGGKGTKIYGLLLSSRP